MSPLQQGYLDCLCGVYAVINAVNYLHGPLRKARVSQLFELCLRQLATKRCVIERIIRYGTIGQDISGLLILANQHYRLVRSKPFHRQARIELEAFWRHCQQFLRQPHTLILMAIGGTHAHWTWVYRITDTRMLLFDSAQLKHLSKRHCQMANDDPLVKRHYFYPSHTYFLRRSAMTSCFKAGEKPGEYITTGPVTADDILNMAKQLIQRKFARGQAFDKPDIARAFLPHQLALLEHETFWVLFLDNQHRVLAFEQLFSGTLDQASVYPREVVKRGLQLNAKAVILAHNHPSGNSNPSQQDKFITQKLKDALALVEMTVLDHFVVGGDAVTSMAELGWC